MNTCAWLILPVLDPVAWLALTLIATYAIYLAWSRSKLQLQFHQKLAGVTVRLIILAALLLALINPVLPVNGPQRTSTTTEIWLDRSASMSAHRPTTRPVKHTADKHADMQWVLFDQTRRNVHADQLPATQPAGSATRWRQLLMDRLAEPELPGRILLVTDGRDTDASKGTAPALASLIESANRNRVPIDVMPIGPPDAPAPLQLFAWPQSEHMTTAQPAKIHAIIQAPTGPVTLDLYQEQKKIATRLITQPHPTPGKPIPLTVPPPKLLDGQPAIIAYRLTASRPEAPNDKPATAMVFIQWQPKPIRVLMITGRPAWNTRMTIQLLNHDSRFELTTIIAYSAQRTVVQQYLPDSPNTASQTTPDSPRDEAAIWQNLNSYQLIILDADSHKLINDTHANQLASHLRQGAGLLAHADCGIRQPALLKLLPAKPIGVSSGPAAFTLDPKAVDLKLLDARTLNRLKDQPADTVTGIAEIDIKPHATTLAHAQQGNRTTPAVVIHRQANARVGLIAVTGLWRLWFTDTRHARTAQVYQLFMTRLMEYLAGHRIQHGRPELAVFHLNMTVGQTQTCQLTSRTPLLKQPEPEQAPLQARSPTGQTVNLHWQPDPNQPEQARVQFQPRIPGVWQLNWQVAGQTCQARFYVQPDDLETRYHQPDHPPLIQLAQQTGGRLIQPGAVLQTMNTDMQNHEPGPVTGYDSLWARTWILLSLLAIFLADIAWRRRVGLP